MHNHNKFVHAFVDLSPAIFTLCVSLVAAWSLIAVTPSSSDSATEANISKTIKCVPIKFLQVDGTIKLNIRYTFVVMATNCDVIIA